MLQRIQWWRHVVVAAAVVMSAVLAFFGVIGGGNRAERFDAKQITISPGGGDALDYREVVDEDFANNRRHGYQRIIPNDFGPAQDVTASSPNANADVHVSDAGFDTTIRIGDPHTTYQNQHRYVLHYTLPQTQLSSGHLNVDVVMAGVDAETNRFDVVLTGFVLRNTFCSVGPDRSSGGCTLHTNGDGDYTVSFNPLHKGDGVSLGGDIARLTSPVLPPEPPLPAYRPNNRVRLALGLIPIGLAAGLLVLLIEKLLGRNEVFSGGAAEAAYGRLPAPGSPVSAMVDPGTTRSVTDAELERLTTVEFVPPKGLEPWQGAVLLKERIDNSTISAWFSGLAGREGITLATDDGTLTMTKGPRYDELDATSRSLVDGFLGSHDELRMGTYDSGFAAAWKKVSNDEVAFVKSSGWWKRHVPRASVLNARPMVVAFVAFMLLVFGGGALVWALIGLFQSLPLAIAFGFVVPAVAAFAMYSVLLPVRSATGSALAILTESFRKFLVASEARHVDWAWKQGLLREYSAWAVSLGAADAWGKALEASNVPTLERTSLTTPLLVYSMSSSFSSSHTPPSSSGSGGGFSGGGFSGGGSVGGGGGGGSSGSW